MGTATYFSPEQASGAAVDGRSDVYALGVVLYEMLVGRPPFIGDTPVEVSSQHVNAAVPSMGQFAESVPKDLEAIVMEALSKSPENRYQSADELRAELIRFSEGQPVEAAQRDTAFFGADATRAVAAVPGERTRSVPIMSGPRTDVRRRRRNPVGPIILVLIVLIAAGVGAYAYVSSNKTNTVTLPRVVGQTVLSATQELTNEGFVVGTKQVNSAKPKNTVLSMSPKAGKSLAKGSSVELTVSLGARTSPVTITDLVGMTLANAENQLSQQQLSYVVSYTSNAQAGQIPGIVLSQSPISGTKTQTGATVTLVVLAPNTQYPLTSVDGLSQVAAGAKLQQQGLLPASTRAHSFRRTQR
jgi:serine/threonine-protein kinase